MKKLILKTLIFISLFIVFNINEIDSNNDKVLHYDKTDIHLEDTFKVYFKSLNSNELDNILKYVNVEVMNYIIDDKKYYARNINELTKTFIKDKSIEDKIYYELNGIKIDGITITCEVNELMKLENLTKVY
ncbi:MAG: hypothetical protein MSH48_06130 [Mollicutes bacterium]|nr:hypothetical protein [Mollicutes bacterium]